MTQAGALRGIPDFRGTYGNYRGGSWAGNRGRVSVDEIRMWGVGDNDLQSGRRLINTSWARGISSTIYAEDVGSIVNILSGTIVVSGVGSPFNAMYNSAGTIQCQGGVGGQTTVFESNTVVQNTYGSATSVLSLGTVVGGNTYSIGGAACTLATHQDVESLISYATYLSGTLAVTTSQNFAAGLACGSGTTITNYTGFSLNSNVNTGAGTITNAIGLDMPFLTIGGTLSNGIRIGGTGRTISAVPPSGSSGASINLLPASFTFNFSSVVIPPVISATGTFQLQQSGNTYGLFTNGFMNYAITFKNTTTTTGITINATSGYRAVPVYQADGASVSLGGAGAGGQHIMFQAAPGINVINSGVVTAGTIYGFYSGGGTFGLGSSGVLTTWTDFYVTDVSVSGSGATMTTHVGLDIGALTAATTNIGIRLAANANPIQMAMSTTGPTTGNLTSNTNGVMTLYHGATNYYLLIAFNDAGTVRYKYLELNGTGTSWAQGTSLPT